MRYRDAFPCFLLILTVTFIGCGGRESLHCVRGHVRFSDGSPVSAGMVECYSVSGAISRQALLDKDGAFQIGSPNGRDGLVAGTHQVLIRPSGDVALLTPQHVQHLPKVHPKYLRFETSGLQITIPVSQSTVEVELVVDEVQ
jgi:hypothetical protein